MPVAIQTKATAESHPKIETISQMIRTKAESHFHALDLDDPEVSVVLTDDATIRQLNAEWRHEEKATDVLSFPFEPPPGVEEAPAILGDIVIDIDYAERLVDTREHQRRVADELDLPPDQLDWGLEDEIHFLFIHGLLHLIGHDHLEADEERQMKAAERRLWEAADGK